LHRVEAPAVVLDPLEVRADYLRLERQRLIEMAGPRRCGIAANRVIRLKLDIAIGTSVRVLAHAPSLVFPRFISLRALGVPRYNQIFMLLGNHFSFDQNNDRFGGRIAQFAAGSTDHRFPAC
jgi:hypothetical protein